MEEKIAIIALPFAGGCTNSYATLKRFTPTPFEWISIEIPGRGNRINELAIPDIESVCDDIFAQILPTIKTTEYLFFGHGMGALLGYELTRRIQQAKIPLPSCLFFTGQIAPSVVTNKKISRYDKHSFWAEIKSLGGISDALFEDQELIDFFEPTIRADYWALDHYEYRPLIERLETPIFIRTGNLDAKISAGKIDMWQEETLYPLDWDVYPGSHFFIFDDCYSIMEDLTESLDIAKSMSFSYRKY
ncbi:thioesterase II family protein [Ascidiimonas sp. W6]|uniref:thioesterase II family protein n=1 Tax=Ascidiimonas meishanensis TaxID=3128903 RepID=UPI0030EF19A8